MPPMNVPAIRVVAAGQLPELLGPLVKLLQDSVDGGASVGFLPPLKTAEARAYWENVRNAINAGHRVLLVAEIRKRLVGSVQLDLATKPNASHRAEVIKLLVLTESRRKGIARALMQAVEEAALARGRTLLGLDTRRGDAAEKLYRRLGWTQAGVIPRYARNAVGDLDDTVLFYRDLGEKPGLRLRELEDADVPVMHRWLSDINVIRYMTFTLHTLEETATLVRDVRLGRPFSTRQNLMRGLASEGGQLVGICGLLIDENREQAEAWYLVDPAHAGRGYATEAGRQLLALGFGEFRLQRIRAGVLPENPASMRVLEKAGFRNEGLQKKAIRVHGELRDEYVYAILREEWKC